MQQESGREFLIAGLNKIKIMKLGPPIPHQDLMGDSQIRFFPGTLILSA